MPNKKDIAIELSKIHRKLLSDIEFASDEGLEAKRQIRVVAASGKADRTGDIVKVDGIELANFKKNPIILWAHDHYGLPVAKAVEMAVVGGKLVMLLEFAPKETYEFADTVYKLVKGGFLKGVSIGARVLEAEWLVNEQDEIVGRQFSKLELLELSVVPIPADSKALITAVKSGAISCEDMEECLAKSFDAPLDFTPVSPVESNTDRVTTEDTDMEKLAALEQRVLELETTLAQAAKTGEQANKTVSTIEPIVAMLMKKLGVATDGTPDMQSKLMSLIETMTHKVSAPR
jgi:HK97 family phage prohead protease